MRIATTPAAPTGMSTNATVRKRHRSTESSRLTTPRFLARLEAEGTALPAFVKREFDDYLKCGLLEHGFSARQVRYS